MKPKNFRKKYLFFSFIFILLLIHFILGIDTIQHLSPTYDEPLHLTAGYSYLKTSKFYLNIYDHPPFAEMFATIPLIFSKPILLIQHPSWSEYQQYSFANFFLYSNRVNPEKMLNSARIMILIFSCFLGFFIFLWTKELFNRNKAILSLFLYTFSSAFISNGSLVTTDLPLTLFYFLSCYTFYKWLNKQTILNAILTGICFGFANVSKFSSIIIVGVFFLLFLIYRKNIKISFPKVVFHLFVVILVSLFVIMFVYRSNAGLYFDGLYRTFIRLKKGRSSFLFGKYSTEGWWYYFIFVFLIKTPIPLLIMFFTTVITEIININSNKFIFFDFKKNISVFLMIPVLIYFFVASISKVQIGFRHILPIYPFIIILCAGKFFDNLKLVLPSINSNHLYRKLVIIFLIIYYIFSCIKIHPWHLSYFNEFIETNNGYKYLTDSNVDWGQGMKELSKYLRKKTNQPIFLCYFGVSDPNYYRIKYFPVGFINNLKPQERPGENLQELKKLEHFIFCISVTNLQATYYADKNVFLWLKNIVPEKLVAKSILVYDLTNNSKALQKLKEFYPIE